MPEFASASMFTQILRIKIKVTNRDDNLLPEKRERIFVDRDTVTFVKLKKHLVKSFKLESTFLITYISNKSDTPLAIADDWDLDAALQQTRHTLKLIVHSGYAEERGDSAGGISLPQMISRLNEPTDESIWNRVVSKMKLLFSSKDKEGLMIEQDSVPTVPKKPRMTLREYQTFFDGEGRLINPVAFRESVYRGGLAYKLRKLAWRHLLNIFPEGLTEKERCEYLKKKSTEYKNLKSKWRKTYKDNEGNLPDDIKFVTSMVKKDVIRTDRTHPYFKGKEDNRHIVSLFDLLCTYALNHPDVSYCQGMCDFASPLLVIQDNEAHAYILFCALMERVKYNFSVDGKAISTKFDHLYQMLKFFDKDFHSYLQENQVEDLLFAYRWILLEMKREFAYEDSLYFTEIMWSSLPYQPRTTEITLYQTHESSRSNSLSSALLSPYAKLSTLQEPDSDSESSIEETITNDYLDADGLGVDSIEITREECISHTFDQSLDQEVADIVQNRSCATLSEAACIYSDDVSSLNSECRSTFYIELDDMDYFSFADLSSVADTTQNKAFSKGTRSIDSGYLSRPDSPSRQHETIGVGQFDECVDSNAVFPPPNELGYGNAFVMFAALVMILQHRDEIIEHKMDFNDILMLFNSTMKKNDIKKILSDTKTLYEAYVSNNLQSDCDDFEHIYL